MSYRVVFIEGVDYDIADATEWYENQQKGLGLKFISDWENTINYVTNEPLAFEIKFKAFRQAGFKTFPFLIIFELENNTVKIYSVIHAKRFPSKRYKRSIKGK